jgi:hypothetical protein
MTPRAKGTFQARPAQKNLAVCSSNDEPQLGQIVGMGRALKERKSRISRVSVSPFTTPSLYR